MAGGCEAVQRAKETQQIQQTEARIYDNQNLFVL
jgi:hypothetical protein